MEKELEGLTCLLPPAFTAYPLEGFPHSKLSNPGHLAMLWALAGPKTLFLFRPLPQTRQPLTPLRLEEQSFGLSVFGL